METATSDRTVDELESGTMKLRNYGGRIAEASIEVDRDSGSSIVVFDGNPRTPDDAARDQLGIIEATTEEREALRAAGYGLSSEMWEQEQVLLAQMRARAAEDWRVLKDKPRTERMIVAATLRALGVQFLVGELIRVDGETAPSDVDTAFRDAAFQVTEALGDRHRDYELRAQQKLVNEAETLDDVFEGTRSSPTPPRGCRSFHGRSRMRSLSRSSQPRLAGRRSDTGFVAARPSMPSSM